MMRISLINQNSKIVFDGDSVTLWDILSKRCGGGALEKEKWVLCPICNNKTRIKVRPDTVLENFPLYCPKCKQETIINVTGQNVVAVNKIKNDREGQ